MQQSLFEAPPIEPSSQYALRPYQTEAVDRILEELKEHRGTLCLMATGTGKTAVACEIIRQQRGRCLFIAHRDELIQQAARRIDDIVGGWPDIEQAQDRADTTGTNHVVASIQSLSRPHRLERFDPDEFGLMVIDEFHHAPAMIYRRVINHFTGAKILGLTATPDRSDGEALGQIVDSVAYQYDLIEGIRDGWLCPIVMQTISVKSMDFSKVHTLAGDFNQGELDTIMQAEENLHAVAKPTVELAGERKTLVFTTSVSAAERLAEIIDRYTSPGRACVIHGKTDKEVRRETLRKFHRGEHQFFVNVGIATEGYDEPGISCVVLGRPTKSRSLYVQMLGRGTRGGSNYPIEGKTDLLALDFVGNSGRHDIVCTADVLGGKLSEESLSLTKREIQEASEPLSMEEAEKRATAKQEAIAQERAEELKRQQRLGIVADVQYITSEPNPYVNLGVRRDYLHSKYGYAPATDAQIAMIQKRMGKHAKDMPASLGKLEASRLIGKFVARQKQELCTYPQMLALRKYGFDAKDWSFGQAGASLDIVSKHGWPKPGGKNQAVYAAMRAKVGEVRP